MSQSTHDVARSTAAHTKAEATRYFPRVISSDTMIPQTQNAAVACRRTAARNRFTPNYTANVSRCYNETQEFSLC